MPKRTSPKLAVIGAAPEASEPSPPANLGPIGSSLWHGIVGSYEFNDRAAYETLGQACMAADRADNCRRQIDTDGECIRTKTGIRDHPLLKHEIAARSFVVRTLARLGLDLEPLRAGPGRPAGGGIGWRPDAE